MSLPVILLVEDSDADAEMAIDALREAQLANPIVRVADGVEAMEYLNRQGAYQDRPEGLPALVLLDLYMPRLGGLEVLTQIRADSRLNALPVVILTSSQHDTDLARSWDLGVNAYVIKPVDAAQFLHAVKELGKFWILLNETPGHLSDPKFLLGLGPRAGS